MRLHTTRYVPSELSVTFARVCEGPRMATKKESPPVLRFRPIESCASIQKWAAWRTVASVSPSPRTLECSAQVSSSLT